MIQMFQGCSSLTSLNLESFDTSNVQMIHYMFNGCSSLSSLDLSKFRTSQVTEIERFFQGCINLEYINIKNFNGNRIINGINHYVDFLGGVPDNVVIYTSNDLGDILNGEINKKTCKAFITNDNDNNNWRTFQIKIIDKTGECIQKCDLSDTYKYEYNGRCYDNCTKGYITDEITGIIFCKCELDQCLKCPPVALSKNLCTVCNDNYYGKENDILNIGEYINCYKDPLGYYLDKNDSLYKKCYHSCETCEIKGNNSTHNCQKCKNNFSIEIEKNNYFNCYENCSFYHYFDENKIYFCTNNYSCPDEYPNLINHKLECSKNIDIYEIIKNLGKNDTVLKYIENYLTSEFYDTSLLDKGEEEILKVIDITFTLETLQNEKNNINKNKTSIDFKECENILINKFNLYNKTLYIKKIEAKEDEMKIPKIEYDIYYKFNNTYLKKLDLSICENEKILISIPIILKENLEKLNSSSEYYNDICYTTTSESGTDIILNDRQKEFCDKNKMVCQEDCEFIKYDNDSNKASCYCNVKESSISFSDMKINKKKIFKSFIDFKNIANISILKCYKILFSIKGIIKNIGSYIIIIISLFNIICVFIFYLNQIKKLNIKINNISYGIINSNLIKTSKKKCKKNILSRNKIEDNSQNKIIIENTKTNHFKKNKNKKKNILNINDKEINKIKNLKDNKKIKPLAININNKNIDNNNIINTNNIPNKNKSNKKNKNNRNKNILNSKITKNKIEKIMEYNDEELNKLSYDLSLQLDKRAYCEYYISLLKTKHMFINSFIYNDDYNSKIIKIDLFFIGFTIFYTINALFFNDKTMHKIYESEGKYDFIYQLPKTIYSSLISFVFETLLNILALSNDVILEFKRSKKIKSIEKREKKLKKILKIKFVLYFILSFLFLMMFWYYIAMFGAIYKNTQLHLLKDTLTSFSLSFLYPFGIYLLPGIFRIYALSNTKKERKCIYNLSKILQML